MWWKLWIVKFGASFYPTFIKKNSNRMVKDNTWRYFKPGDIVKNEEVWGKKLFEISSLHGNAYLPLATVFFVGRDKTNDNLCNFDVRQIKLVSSNKRPFRNLPKKQLILLMKRGIEEARREFIMRTNSKTL